MREEGFSVGVQGTSWITTSSFNWQRKPVRRIVKVERATTTCLESHTSSVDTGKTRAHHPSNPSPEQDAHDTYGRAPLARASAHQWETRFDAATRGMIEDATDVDFYRISAPVIAHAPRT